MDDHMEERFLTPAMSPDAAAIIDAQNIGGSMDAIGHTPAASRVDAPAEEQIQDPSKRLAGVLRNHLRQSAAVSDRMRGVNIKWQTSDIPKEPPRPITSAGSPPTSARVPTYVKSRDGEPSAKTLRAPMDRVLAGTVRKMVQQDASFRKSHNGLSVSGEGEHSAVSDKLPALDTGDSAATRITGYLQQLARDSFEAPRIDQQVTSMPSRVEESIEP